MKIECISRRARDLPEALVRSELGLGPDHEFALEVGKQYVVYAITVYLAHLWYYICDEDNTYYPIWNPSPLFRIVDSRLSSYWHIGFHSASPQMEAFPIIAFDQWVADPLFYDKLTDGQEDAVALFREYKRLMDIESECS